MVPKASQISNSPAGVGLYEVTVSDECGHVLLRSSAGATRIDEPVPEPDMSPVRLRHISGKAVPVGWHGAIYEPDDESGVITVPGCSVSDILPHGFIHVRDEE